MWRPSRRLKLEVIPGYLIAGVIVGPHALALIPENSTNIKGVSDLATVLLLFSIGLDLDIGHIRRGMVHILAIGVISTLVFSLLNWLLLLAVGVARPQASSSRDGGGDVFDGGPGPHPYFTPRVAGQSLVA